MGVPSDLVRSQRQSRRTLWNGSIEKLEHLGHGVSGMVLVIDEKRVAKIDIGSSRSIDDIETEREIYRRLSQGSCRYVLKCYEFDNPNGIVLERCNNTVRNSLKSKYRNGSPPNEVVKKWVYEAAQGLAYIHRHGIVQGDVGCHNMLLSSDNTLKLADFAGSSIDGSPSTVDYEVRSRIPGAGEPDQVSDIFALGSAMWEIATGSPPYHDKSWREVNGLYKRAMNGVGKFPKLQNMPELGQIIRNCWDGSYKHAQDVAYGIEVAYLVFDTGGLSSGSQNSLEYEKTVGLPWGREAPTKHQYVEHATSHRYKARKYELDPERWNAKCEKYGSKKNKKSGFFNWFKPSYSYGVIRA